MQQTVQDLPMSMHSERANWIVDYKLTFLCRRHRIQLKIKRSYLPTLQAKCQPAYGLLSVLIKTVVKINVHCF
jgi:hypothetical protein